MDPLVGTGPFARNTRILASFHSDVGFNGNVGEGLRGFGLITGCSTSKAFGDAAGHWSLNIKVPPGQLPLLSQYIDPEDVWVRVQVRINGQVFDLMIGLIDSIVEDEGRNPDGAQVRTYIVSGSDFGKCFAKLELFINFWATSGPPVPQNLLYTHHAVDLNLPFGSPDEVVRGLIQMWLGNDGASEKQWMLPASLRGGPTGARYLFDWLNLSSISTNLRGRLPNDAALLSPDPLMGRSLWDVMEEYNHNLLNEMWVDLGVDPELEDGANRLDALRPSVFMRERPFPTIKSTRRWDSLRTAELGSGDVKKRHIVSGDGGASRFNWWELIPNGLSATSSGTQALLQHGDGLPGGIPIINTDSMRRHGLRRYAQQSKYLSLPETDTSFLQYAIRWTRIVHDWYSVAPFQYTGNITTTRMRPDIRIGMRVRETRSDGSIWIYYVEGVDHRYNYPAESETALTVTRGQLERDNFLDHVYSYYRGVDISTLSDSEVQDSVPATETAAVSPDEAPTPPGDPDVAIPPEDALTAPSGTGRSQMEVFIIPFDTASATAGVHAVDDSTGGSDQTMVSPPEDAEDTDISTDEFYGTGAELEIGQILILPRDNQTSPDRPTTGDNPEIDPQTAVGSGPEAPAPPATRGRP